MYENDVWRKTLKVAELPGFRPLKKEMEGFPRVPPSTNYFTIDFCHELVFMPWRNRGTSDVADRALDGSVVLHYRRLPDKEKTLLGVGVTSSPFIIEQLRQLKRPLTMAQVLSYAAEFAEGNDSLSRRWHQEEGLTPETKKRIAAMRVKALRFVYRNGNPKIPKIILKDIEKMCKKKSV